MTKSAMSKVYAQALVHPSFSEFVDFAREQGCNLEVATLAYANVFDTDWPRVMDEQRQMIGGLEGKISFHGVFQDLLVHSSDRKIAEVSRERILSSLKAAEVFNATQVVFHGNFNPFVRDEYYKKNWVERNASFWSEVLEKHEVTILLENTWESSSDMFRRLLDRINSPRFRICFDIGHANVYSKVPIREWFAEIGREITYIHISDNSGEKDQHLGIGQGKINWQEFTDIVEENRVNPEIVLELTTLESTKQSLKYLEEKGIYPFRSEI